jgi:hypothetical protein
MRCRRSEIGFHDGRILAHGFRLPLGNGAAGGEDMQAVAEAHDEPHVVIDDEETQPAPARQLGKVSKQHFGLRLVHPRRRLVK